jgi:hypothetical protein
LYRPLFSPFVYRKRAFSWQMPQQPQQTMLSLSSV